MPSRKQEIYAELLHVCLPFIRNALTQSWWRRAAYRSAYYESELIHNLSVTLLEPEFHSHDLWFLNHQAQSYCGVTTANQSALYDRNVELLRELFRLVPADLRSELEWTGPTPG